MDATRITVLQNSSNDIDIYYLLSTQLWLWYAAVLINSSFPSDNSDSAIAGPWHVHTYNIVMCCVTAAAAPAPRPPIGPHCRHPPPSLHTTTRRSSLNQSCEFIYLDNWLFLCSVTKRGGGVHSLVTDSEGVNCGVCLIVTQAAGFVEFKVRSKEFDYSSAKSEHMTTCPWLSSAEVCDLELPWSTQAAHWSSHAQLCS